MKALRTAPVAVLLAAVVVVAPAAVAAGAVDRLALDEGPPVAVGVVTPEVPLLPVVVGPGPDLTLAPTVTTHPASTAVVAGDEAVFTAAAGGLPTPSVQWQRSTDDGVTYVDLAGQTQGTLRFTPDLGDSGHRYRARFTNLLGTATSQAATLTVTQRPDDEPDDDIAPGVRVEQAVGQVDPATTSPLLFAVTFDQPVTGFGDAPTDTLLGGTAGASTAEVTGSGSEYTVAVSGMTAAGTVTLDVPAASASDAEGSPNTPSTSSDNQVTWAPDTPPDTPPDTTPDTTPPVVTSSVGGDLGNGDWHVSDVTIEWTVTDPDSPVTDSTGCAPTTIAEDTGGHVLTCTATSSGGATSRSVTINRDATPPTLETPSTRTVEATGPSGAAVAFDVPSADDAMTGVATTCTAGQGATFPIGTTAVDCTAVDGAGNTTATSFEITVRDSTAPTVAISAPTRLALRASARASVRATDAVSGIGAQSCAALSTGTVGVRSVTCRAVDGAGNAAQASAAYVVTHAFLGFTSPRSRLPRASTIPVSFAVGTAGGARTTTGAVLRVGLGTDRRGGTLSSQRSTAACAYSRTARAYRCHLPRRGVRSGTTYYLSVFERVPGSTAWHLLPRGPRGGANVAPVTVR